MYVSFRVRSEGKLICVRAYDFECVNEETVVYLAMGTEASAVGPYLGGMCRK